MAASSSSSSVICLYLLLLLQLVLAYPPFQSFFPQPPASLSPILAALQPSIRRTRNEMRERDSRAEGLVQQSILENGKVIHTLCRIHARAARRFFCFCFNGSMSANLLSFPLSLSRPFFDIPSTQSETARTTTVSFSPFFSNVTQSHDRGLLRRFFGLLRGGGGDDLAESPPSPGKANIQPLTLAERKERIFINPPPSSSSSSYSGCFRRPIFNSHPFLLSEEEGHASLSSLRRALG